MTTDLATLHSDVAERSVLGGMLLRPTLVGATTLEVRDFHSMRHQLVFEAMLNLDVDGLAIDPTTVVAEIRRMGRIGVFGDESGAVGYIIGDLAAHVPSPENVQAYAETLVRYARKRSALEALGELVHKLRTTEEADGEDVILDAITTLQRLDLREPDPTIALGDSMRDELRQIYVDLGEREKGNHVGGMPSGLHMLDGFTGGFPIGCVTLVLGETGHGKSTLAMKFARAAVELAGDRPLVFSYEDGHRSFAQRALAQDARVPTSAITRRNFRGTEARDLSDFGGKAIGKRRERIAAWRGQGVDELCRVVRRMRSRGPEHGAKSVGRLVIVDYLQAIPKPYRRGLGTPEAIGENAATLEDLAAREQVAVVLMSQVNDEPSRRDDHRPQGRDVAGSRDPFKGCKLCLGLYRPAMYDEKADPKDGEILILKNNQGPANKAVAVRLDLETHTIRDADSDRHAGHEQRRFAGA